VSARCELTKSLSTQKLRRDNMKFFLQGLHKCLQGVR
jgi:hypothetical protein